MHTVIKNITLGLAMLFTVVVSANNPGLDNLENAKEVLPEAETTIKIMFKVNSRDVEDVFLKIKRVDRIITPKKKLSKVKYTIA
ncbi:hypothetical protein FHR24_001202 [Wenyingzhuangia heitensis]|uniref:Uncharacterized protein n=1 Tax=Wenyingzhuangia heitensis TaxID=1487859 RepID=A0ABX0U974_9FLAO|nr:hypothetical protein [Wenyingzhuangia heitensis]NIJ44763.1 hypothetical protein [Wenyingzhuangia heitensis]